MKKMPELQKQLRDTPSSGTALGGKVKVPLSKTGLAQLARWLGGGGTGAKAVLYLGIG